MRAPAAAVLALFGFSGLMASFIATPEGGAAETTSGITITAGPKWGEVTPDSWTPYSVTVTNQGDADVDGEVVLRPEPQPTMATPPTVLGQTTTTTTPTDPTAKPLPPNVLYVEGRPVSAPVPFGGQTSGSRPPGPTYRVPITVSVASEKTLTVMVLEPEFGFAVELVDDGRVLARAESLISEDRAAYFGDEHASREHPRNQLALALLSGSVNADNQLETLPQEIIPLSVTQLTALDFPEIPLHLAGVDAVVIDDFDTSTLSPPQRRALQDYVSLGGSLVLAGGANWSRTLGSLPAELVPLQATASAPTSLAPLADLAATTTAAVAVVDVATGELTAGRVMLAAVGGPPLVVRSDYGLGQVIQLTYDPMDPLIASDVVLQRAAWDQAVGRIAGRAPLISNLDERLVSTAHLWASTLEPRRWPSPPRRALGLLVGYALLLGPAAFMLSRRLRPSVSWVVTPLTVMLTVGACIAVARPLTEATETVVEVRTLGAGGTELTTVYRTMLSLDRAYKLALRPGAASTVFTGQHLFRPSGQPRIFAPSPLPEAVTHGVGGGAITATDSPAVRLSARPWEPRTVQTVSISDEGPSLEANLRLVGGSDTSPGRLQGTVTNKGSGPIRRLRAQILGGQAVLPDMLGPGETKSVDAVLGLANEDYAPPRMPPGTAEEVAMFAAANHAFTGTDQIALVGIGSPTERMGGGDGGGMGRRISVMVTVVPLQGADTILGESGRARVVSLAGRAGGEKVWASDLYIPPDPGPLSVRMGRRRLSPGELKPVAMTVEAYSWTTGTWRVLPPAPPLACTPTPTEGRFNAGEGFAGTCELYEYDAPLAPEEVDNGLVRLRGRSTDIKPLGRASYLVETGTR